MTVAAPSPFSTTIPNFQIAWDSTSLGWYKRCPKYYKYTMLDGWISRSKSIHLMFGGWYASGVERYAHAAASGMSHHDATVHMVRWVLENSGVRDEDGVFHPWDSGDSLKNRYTLIRSLVWNVEDRLGTPFKTLIKADGKPAVELSFSFPLFTLDDETIFYSGHMDEVVEYEHRYWVKDDKAQPTYCKVLTPTGWQEIGSLKIGDRVAGKDGLFYYVDAIHPKGKVPTYRVEFHDNTHTDCGEDHLWNIAHDGNDDWKTLPLNKFMDAVNRGQRRHVPVAEAIKHDYVRLEVDPYLLGALLGDGYLGGSSVTFSTANDDLIEDVSEAVDRMGDVLKKSPSDNLVWTITNKRHCATLAGLRALKLWGCLSTDKFIPEKYLFSSLTQRKALLAGLLDTDGSWAGNSRRYQTMSYELAHGVAALVRSLGGVASVTLQPRRMYRVTIRLGERGIPIRRRYIKSVTRIDDVENVCIAIDSDDHLYVTDNYIVTHNTTKNSLDANYRQQFSPDNQMSGYTIAGKIVLALPVEGVLVRAAQIGVNFNRFTTFPVPRPQAVLDEWTKDAQIVISRAKEDAIRGHWPMNDKACFGCEFRRVCSVSPSHRAAWLKDDFIQRPPWNPLQARGDV